MKTCMHCVHVPAELPFWMPPLVVGQGFTSVHFVANHLISSPSSSPPPSSHPIFFFFIQFLLSMLSNLLPLFCLSLSLLQNDIGETCKLKTWCTTTSAPNQQPTLNEVPAELRRRNFVNYYRLSMQIGAKRAKTCMHCVHVPTELPFCTPLLAVGQLQLFSIYLGNL